MKNKILGLLGCLVFFHQNAADAWKDSQFGKGKNPFVTHRALRKRLENKYSRHGLNKTSHAGPVTEKRIIDLSHYPLSDSKQSSQRNGELKIETKQIASKSPHEVGLLYSQVANPHNETNNIVYLNGKRFELSFLTEYSEGN